MEKIKLMSPEEWCKKYSTDQNNNVFTRNEIIEYADYVSKEREKQYKDNFIPKEITREKLLFGYEHFLTVGDLKEYLLKHDFPNEAKVVVQRVEDSYYRNSGWDVYLKIGEHAHNALQWNEDVKNGKYLNKDDYPNMKEENLKLFTEDQIKLMMEQYHPVWCCVRYSDDPNILFLDLHY